VPATRSRAGDRRSRRLPFMIMEIWPWEWRNRQELPTHPGFLDHGHFSANGVIRTQVSVIMAAVPVGGGVINPETQTAPAGAA